MNRRLHILPIALLLHTCCFLACKKDLQRQSSTAFDVAHTPEAFQALLDNDLLFGLSPMAGILSGEQVQFTDTYVDFLLPVERNLLTWQPAIYADGETVIDWNRCYEQVNTANQVIVATTHSPEGVASTTYHSLQGQALFFRAWAFWQLAQLYAQPWDSLQADKLPGIPLPTGADVNAPTTRATLKATYKQILDDLSQAAQLLPPTFDKAHPNRPSRAAAFAMLTRVHLSMHHYQEAATAAGNCLQLYKVLTDYRLLNATAPFPFSVNHPEVIYQNWMQDETRFLPGLVGNNFGFVEPGLYNSYAPGDLRRALFFRSAGTQAQFKGSYAGSFNPFMGIAVDEVYLTRAESLAQLGQTTAALNDLDTLLIKRFAEGYFIPRKTNNKDTVLAWIYAEREKELVLRGHRWSDLRRLNKEGYNIPFTRNVKGITYTLDPNDRRYTLPIPPQAVKEDGLTQNLR
jgi:hypothetical protein